MPNPNVAAIDANDKPTIIAWNETTQLTERVYVDPTTGALLVFNTANTGSATTSLQTAKIDENDNATLLGWDDTSHEIEAMRCDADGNLLTILV